MKTRTIALTLGLCFVAAAVAFASNPYIGTWKLNEAKSKIPASAPKNTSVVYEAAGDSIKVTVEGVDGTGKPTHNEWTGKFDGKDYPLTGDPTADTRSYKKINDSTAELTNKKDGKPCSPAELLCRPTGKPAPSRQRNRLRMARKSNLPRSTTSNRDLSPGSGLLQECPPAPFRSEGILRTPASIVFALLNSPSSHRINGASHAPLSRVAAGRTYCLCMLFS